MGVSTARDIIRLALHELGIIAIAETPSAEDTDLSFDKLNLLVDLWSGKRLMHLTTVKESFTLVASQNSYAIGDGQTFDTVKPLNISSAFLRSGTRDYPLAVVDRENYDREPEKTLEGKCIKLFYDKGASQQATRTGTIYLYPTPDEAYTLFLNMIQPFTQFTSLDNNVTFPTGYKSAIISNLAVSLAPAFRVGVSKELAYSAKDSYDTIVNINTRDLSSSIEITVPGQLRSGNISGNEV